MFISSNVQNNRLHDLYITVFFAAIDQKALYSSLLSYYINSVIAPRNE